MNQKLIDFDYTLAVIRSCKTSAQNNVAYHMAFNFHNKHKDLILFESLLDECDNNLLGML